MKPRIWVERSDGLATARTKSGELSRYRMFGGGHPFEDRTNRPFATVITTPVRYVVEPMPIFFEQRDGRDGRIKRRNLDVEPFPTVLANGGMGDIFASPYRIVQRGSDSYMPDPSKPPYRIPTMAEIFRFGDFAGFVFEKPATEARIGTTI